MIGIILRLLTVAAAFGVVLSAATLYRVKTETREVLSEIRTLERQKRQIAEDRRAIAIEWAYLNSPGVLSVLVSEHAEALRLQERTPESFARLSELPPRGALESTE